MVGRGRGRYSQRAARSIRSCNGTVGPLAAPGTWCRQDLPRAETSPVPTVRGYLGEDGGGGSGPGRDVAASAVQSADLYRPDAVGDSDAAADVRRPKRTANSSDAAGLQARKRGHARLADRVRTAATAVVSARAGPSFALIYDPTEIVGGAQDAHTVTSRTTVRRTHEPALVSQEDVPHLPG